MYFRVRVCVFGFRGGALGWQHLFASGSFGIFLACYQEVEMYELGLFLAVNGLLLYEVGHVLASN